MLKRHIVKKCELFSAVDTVKLCQCNKEDEVVCEDCFWCIGQHMRIVVAYSLYFEVDVHR